MTMMSWASDDTASDQDIAAIVKTASTGSYHNFNRDPSFHSMGTGLFACACSVQLFWQHWHKQFSATSGSVHSMQHQCAYSCTIRSSSCDASALQACGRWPRRHHWPIHRAIGWPLTWIPAPTLPSRSAGRYRSRCTCMRLAAAMHSRQNFLHAFKVPCFTMQLLCPCRS